MVIVNSRTVRRGESWTDRARGSLADASRAGSARARAGGLATGGLACSGGLAGSGRLAPCGGSAAVRPSGGRALVRSRLCAPFALHCKYLLFNFYLHVFVLLSC